MQRNCSPAHGDGVPSCAAHTRRSSSGDGDPAHFAATFKVGKFRAVEVARDEEYKEGSPFWLCRRTFITSLHLLSLSGTLLTRAGGLLRYSG